MNKKKILTSILASAFSVCIMSVSAYAADVWDGTADTAWYTGAAADETVYGIDTAEGLAGFAQLVNSGNTFKGKTVKLAESVDLNDKEWTPIGYGVSFEGTFDGQGNTVSNLCITKTFENTSENNCIGFFGKSSYYSVIQNLVLENVDVSGSLNVGAVLGGSGGSSGKILNCTVKGDIAVDAWWYSGAIMGKGYAYIEDCVVEGTNDSYIKGNDGSYIGGIVGFMGENANKIIDCHVSNLNVTGVDRIGGISGIAHYGNQIIDCSVSNVDVHATGDARTVGLIAGGNQGTDSEPSWIINNAVENSTAVTDDGATVITTQVGTTRHDGTDDGIYTIIGTDVVLDDSGKIVSGNFERLTDEDEIAEGYEIDTETGTVAKKLPEAEVTILEPLTLTAAEHNYMVWPSGDATVDRPLEILMNFKAKDEDPGEWAKYLTDFYLTIDGLANDSIIADNCYLAGNYGTFGWIVIPTDGTTIENGVTYPVVSGYDATLNYNDICTSVKDFTAAIHIDKAILEANPNMTVKLELKMTNPDDTSDVLVIGEPAVYDVDDLMGEPERVGNSSYVRNLKINDEYVGVVLFGSIDGLDYSGVGFDVTIAGTTKPFDTTKVHSKVTVGGVDYTPDMYGKNMQYIFAYELRVPVALKSEALTFTPFAYDLDGNKIPGTTKTMDYIYNK